MTDRHLHVIIRLQRECVDLERSLARIVSLNPWMRRPIDACLLQLREYRFRGDNLRRHVPTAVLTCSPGLELDAESTLQLEIDSANIETFIRVVQQYLEELRVQWAGLTRAALDIQSGGHEN